MDPKIMEVLAEFLKAARHVRNYPHPQIPIERLAREATLAEMNAEYVLGKEVFAKIEQMAFAD